MCVYAVPPNSFWAMMQKVCESCCAAVRVCCRLISDHQLETTGSPQLTPVLRLLAGAGAGIVAMSATYPLDMVRAGLGAPSDSCWFPWVGA